MKSSHTEQYQKPMLTKPSLSAVSLLGFILFILGFSHRVGSFLFTLSSAL